MHNIDNSFDFFCDLFSHNYAFSIWILDKHFNLLKTNCKEEKILKKFKESNNKLLIFLKEYHYNTDKPVIFTLESSITEFALFHNDKIYLLGPVYIEDSILNTKLYLNSIELPLIHIGVYFQYCLLFHFCVTGKKISYTDFNLVNNHYIQTNNTDNEKSASISEINVLNEKYLLEQQILNIVESGNLEYLKNTTHYANKYFEIAINSSDNSLRQLKNTCISFSTLCSHSAINGGLAPDIAILFSQFYIQKLEKSLNHIDVVSINTEMFKTFTEQVHFCKLKTLSPFTKKCHDFIELNIENNCSIKSLATYTGYSEQYIGKKFKAERKISIKEYINQQKIEHAKHLLENTQLSIGEITDRLCFGSISYFSKTFKSFTNTTPALYRANKNNL